MKPEFIRLLPDEVERFGPTAAIVLAHIRFRCASDGPGRLDCHGHRYWRVAHDDLGRAVGLTGKAVRGALTRLGDAVVAEHFSPLSDQSRAYRIAEPATSQKTVPADADLPVDRTGIPDAPTGISNRPYGHLQLPVGADVLPIEELKVEGEEPPGSRPAPPPSSKALQTANSDLIGPYGPRCARHRLVEHPPACGGCGQAREAAQAAEAAAAAQADAAYAAMLDGVKGCPACDDNGWVETPAGVADCTGHLTVRSWRKLRTA